jgi:hypothetical protein
MLFYYVKLHEIANSSLKFLFLIGNFNGLMVLNQLLVCVQLYKNCVLYLTLNKYLLNEWLKYVDATRVLKVIFKSSLYNFKMWIFLIKH